jgi:hypothetical protein
MSNPLTPVSKHDYLDQDDAIRGQNFVCLSFISPEDALKDKEAFFLSAYLKRFVSRNNELMSGIETLFPEKTDCVRSIREQYNVFFDEQSINDDYIQFKRQNEIEITDQYTEQNQFQTCVRGIKVRGSYDTLQEAQARAELLRRIDNNKHNIYIAQVGCWCPWAANPDDVGDVVYTETQLNTLMKEYVKNKDSTDAFYDERKRDLIARTVQENKSKMQQIKEDEYNDDLGKEGGGDLPSIFDEGSSGSSPKPPDKPNFFDKLKIDQGKNKPIMGLGGGGGGANLGGGATQ